MGFPVPNGVNRKGKREPGVNPGRSGHCKQGAKPQLCHCIGIYEKARYGSDL